MFPIKQASGRVCDIYQYLSRIQLVELGHRPRPPHPLQPLLLVLQSLRPQRLVEVSSVTQKNVHRIALLLFHLHQLQKETHSCSSKNRHDLSMTTTCLLELSLLLFDLLHDGLAVLKEQPSKYGDGLFLDLALYGAWPLTSHDPDGVLCRNVVVVDEVAGTHHTRPAAAFSTMDAHSLF